MTKFIAILLTSVLTLTQVWAAIQQITIYQKPGQQGSSVTFRTKEADLSDWAFFLNNAASYCAIGTWDFFDLPNFEYTDSVWGDWNKTETCGDNPNFEWYKSFRFYGPEDSEKAAISLYEGNGTYVYGGREYLVTGRAGANVTFDPVFALSFGQSSWTLFTGKDFGGNSTCFEPNYDGEYAYSGSMLFGPDFIVQSVVKGCEEEEVAKNIELFKNSLNLN